MSALTSGQLYLAMVTFAAFSSYYSSNFQYVMVSSPGTPALWGDVFTFLCSTHNAVVFNMAALGLHAIWKGAEAASRLLHVHVVLYFGTYLLLLLLNFLAYDNDKISWTQGKLPSDKIGYLAIPIFLFNFLILPLGLRGGQMPCRMISVSVAN